MKNIGEIPFDIYIFKFEFGTADCTQQRYFICQVFKVGGELGFSFLIKDRLRNLSKWRHTTLAIQETNGCESKSSNLKFFKFCCMLSLLSSTVRTFNLLSC